MKMDEIKKTMKPFVWGIVSGAAVLLIVIFAAGWVVTSGSAQAASEEVAAKAVVDRLAPYCVIKYKQDPNRADQLEALKKVSSWEQEDFIKKTGWATMPGEKTPSGDVALECAKRILALKETAKQ
jgi:hypothetical protein